MENNSWRERLALAVKESGLSYRAASVKAGRGPGYIHGLLRDGKEPTIDYFISLAEALDVSFTWLAFGVDLSTESENLVRMFDQMSPEKKKTILDLAKMLAADDHSRPTNEPIVVRRPPSDHQGV